MDARKYNYFKTKGNTYGCRPADGKTFSDAERTELTAKGFSISEPTRQYPNEVAFAPRLATLDDLTARMDALLNQ